MSVIALDIGGTKISGSCFTADGIPGERLVRLLDGRTGEEVGQLAAEIMQCLIPPGKVDGQKLIIGLCVPGIVRPVSRHVWAPNIPGWDDYPLAKTIAGIAGIPEENILIGSDRTCSILGEVWKGAAAGSSNALFMAVGTGIGLGIMVDGRIVHGLGDIAGATGWMALEPPYHHKFDNCGCFEYYASGSGIGARARDLVKKNTMYKGALRKKEPEEITAHDVFMLYDSGDSIAVEVLEKAIQMWGMASANLVSLFNPEKIIWGGGIFGPACRFIPKICSEARKWAQPVSMSQVSFVPSELGTDAALYGAAKLAMIGNEQ
jgi:glucokinase